MRRIIQAMLASDVPVAVFVSPRGAKGLQALGHLSYMQAIWQQWRLEPILVLLRR